ncbi:MAG: BON domain-containing protein [Planctomycetia bacterium]|nr:BON domain-containing protein [Planctomycetia bacterium]
MATTQRALSDVRPLAQSALADSPIFDLRDLTVEETDDALLLRGSVSSFYHKQMAQEVVKAVAGREVEVVNTVSVR